jgi:hypothetical protein
MSTHNIDEVALATNPQIKVVKFLVAYEATQL